MQPNGEFGGVLARSLTTAGGTLPPGTEISAEDACSWPVANRRALSEGGIIRWHTRPEVIEKVEAVDVVESTEADEAEEPAKRRGRPPKAKE